VVSLLLVWLLLPNVSYSPGSPRDPTYSVSLAFMMNGVFYRLGFGVVGRLMGTSTEGHTINIELCRLHVETLRDE
jgi:hypothetical protein